MAIYITGDIHGNPIERFNVNSFFEQKRFPEDFPEDKSTVVIICGDFGCVWDYHGESNIEKYNLDWLENKPWTTVFVDGNHENHIRLNNFPVKEWNGGLVHEIRPHILHLMRGQVFTIEDKKFFTFGGASSHDIRDGILDPEKDKEKIKEWNKDYFKMFRVLNQSWWKEELPSVEEMNTGLKHLRNNNCKVDFVITHCLPTSSQQLYSHGSYDVDILTDYLETIRSTIDFDEWYCGHYHDNKFLNDKCAILYDCIYRIN